MLEHIANNSLKIYGQKLNDLLSASEVLWFAISCHNAVIKLLNCYLS